MSALCQAWAIPSKAEKRKLQNGTPAVPAGAAAMPISPPVAPTPPATSTLRAVTAPPATTGTAQKVLDVPRKKASEVAFK